VYEVSGYSTLGLTVRFVSWLLLKAGLILLPVREVATPVRWRVDPGGDAEGLDDDGDGVGRGEN
jgi:hypothetical protein